MSEGSRVPSSNTPVNSRSKGHGGTRGREQRLPAMGTTPGPARTRSLAPLGSPAQLHLNHGDVPQLWVLLRDTELVGLTQHKQHQRLCKVGFYAFLQLQF